MMVILADVQRYIFLLHVHKKILTLNRHFAELRIDRAYGFEPRLLVLVRPFPLSFIVGVLRVRGLIPTIGVTPLVSGLVTVCLIAFWSVFHLMTIASRIYTGPEAVAVG